MDHDNRHIIRKVDAELTVRSEEPEEDKNRTDWLRKVVQEAIEQLGPELDRKFGEQLFRIETLDIELSVQQSELDKLEDLLEKRILAKIQNTVGTQTKGKRTDRAEKEKKDSSTRQSRLDMLHHFLHTGRSPWWTEADIFLEMEACLEEISVGEWLDFVKPLMQEDDKVISRLVAQLPSSLVHEMVKKSTPDRAFAEKIVQLLEEITRFAKSWNLSASRIRSIQNFINEQVFYAFLGGSLREELVTRMIEMSVDKISWTQTTGRRNIKPEEIIGEWIDQLRDIPIPEADKWIKQLDNLADRFPTREEIQEHEKSHNDKEEYTEKDREEMEEDGLSVQNVGIVILYPFLESLFDNLGLLEDGAFPSDSKRERAVCLVHYLATGSEHFPEHALVLSKFLCGYPQEQPVDRFLPVSDYEKDECASVLNSVLQHWEALKKTSVEGLRTNFLQREGVLKQEELGWALYIERKTRDVLLEKLPWSLSVIKLRWLDEMLTVHWQ